MSVTAGYLFNTSFKKNTGNILNAKTLYYPDSFYSLTRLIITLFIAIVGNAGMWAIVVIMPNLGDEFQVTRSV